MTEPASDISAPAVPDHELLRVIGRGSYGEVWLARSVLGEHRAVKLVRQDGRDGDRPSEREFDGLRKFEPISRSHAGLVQILHVGRFEGGFFYVMELADDAAGPGGSGQLPVFSHPFSVVSSQPPAVASTPPLNTEHRSLDTSSYSPRTLRSELRGRVRLPVAECVELALKLTDALAYLHEHGLVHRDIKPSNIIFVVGQPKLADIGLVASADASMSCVGTEGYLPPEGPGKPPADMYALGKVLYELATGRDRTDFPELPTLLREDTQREALEEFNEVILKACDPDLRRRYQCAAQMRADLLLMQSGRSLRGARALRQRLVFARRAGALVGVAALLAVAAYFYQEAQTREARRLAQAEAEQRGRAENLVSTLQLKEAERLFERDDGNQGVAYLARMLRQNPSNQIAAARLMSALTDRSFAVPVWSFEPGDLQEGADFNPNGRLLVTWGRCGSNRVAQLKDVATGQDVGRPMHHDAAIRRARFSQDGRLLATMASDGVARIWDGVTGEPLSEALPPSGRVYRATRSQDEHLAFSPDGRLLVTARFREARLWNVATGELLAGRLDHGGVVYDVGFSPDSRLVSTSGEEKTRLWEITSGELRHTLDIGDGNEDGRARFSADGRRIVGIGGFHVRVWDVQSGERLLVLDRDCFALSATFSPDGIRLATADSVRTVQLFDASNGRLLLPPILHGDAVEEVSFDATGERILTREPRRARVWDSRTGRPLTEWMSHAEDILTAQFSPGGTHVLTATARRITLWDVRPGQALNLALRHTRTLLVPSARFSGDGTRVVTAGGGRFPTWGQGAVGGAMVWDARTGTRPGTRIATSDGIQLAEFSPDGRRVVTAGLSGEARVWDARTGAALTDTMIHGQAVNSARFSPDGERIVTASEDGTARIWDAATGRPLTAALVHSNAVLYAEFSPDGLTVLTVPRFHAARTWDTQTGGPTGSFGQSTVTARFSPDGQLIVTGSADGTGQVWDLKTGQARGGPLKHRNHIQSVRFSRDGRLVVTASRDQSARIWDAFTGNPMAEPLRHKGALLDAGFSPDGRRVVTASEDYTARVWDVRTGQPLTEPLREGHFVGGAEFSPDGTRLVTATASGLARIWELPPSLMPAPGWLPELADAIAGATWADQEVLEPVLPSEYLTRRAELLQHPEADVQGRWLRWLLADRGDRTVSYASAATFADHLEGLLQQSALPPLREALQLSPSHPLGAARLANRLVGSEYSEMVRHPHRERQADFLSERAVNLAPTHGEVWRIRGEVLDQNGRREEALTAIERAIALTENEPELWSIKGRMLEGAGRDEEAFGAYRKALEVRGNKATVVGLPTSDTAR